MQVQGCNSAAVLEIGSKDESTDKVVWYMSIARYELGTLHTAPRSRPAAIYLAYTHTVGCGSVGIYGGWVEVTNVHELQRLRSQRLLRISLLHSAVILLHAHDRLFQLAGNLTRAHSPSHIDNEDA